MRGEGTRRCNGAVGRIIVNDSDKRKYAEPSLIISCDVPIEPAPSQIYLRLTCNVAITVINGSLRGALNAAPSSAATGPVRE